MQYLHSLDVLVAYLDADGQIALASAEVRHNGPDIHPTDIDGIRATYGRSARIVAARKDTWDSEYWGWSVLPQPGEVIETDGLEF